MKFSGSKLRQLRRAAGMTQIELAQAAGVRERMVGYWERGDFVPGVERAVALATALGVTVDVFMSADAHDAGDGCLSRTSSAVTTPNRGAEGEGVTPESGSGAEGLVGDSGEENG